MRGWLSTRHGASMNMVIMKTKLGSGFIGLSNPDVNSLCSILNCKEDLLCDIYFKSLPIPSHYVK